MVAAKLRMNILVWHGGMKADFVATISEGIKLIKKATFLIDKANILAYLENPELDIEIETIPFWMHLQGKK